jgi:hypothetical protein
MVRYEFDNLEDFMNAMNNLEDYHDCKNCHGKIVMISIDKLGQSHCGYCNKPVDYPRLTEKAMREFVELHGKTTSYHGKVTE